MAGGELGEGLGEGTQPGPGGGVVHGPGLEGGVVAVDGGAGPGEFGVDGRQLLTMIGPARSGGLGGRDQGLGDALVHVKKASSSAPLSHLFAQGLVSSQALFLQPEVRRDFAELVRRHGRGCTVPEDFTPKKVVFGILLKDGEDLTADTLFPFAQVMLCQAAADLEGRGVVVEVVGIRAEHV